MAQPRTRPARSDFRYFCPMTVRWGDLDALGHVNNATYCTYLESARIGFLAGLGWTLAEAARGAPIVVSQTVNYREPLGYPAALEVGVRCGELRHRSFVLEYAIFREAGDAPVADGLTVLAWVDASLGRAVEVPAGLRQALAGG